MKRMKRNWTIALVAAVALAVLGACASYSHFNTGLRSGDFFSQRLEHGDRGMVITSYVGTASDVQIPSHIRGRPVRVIGASAFSGDFAGEIGETFGEEFRAEVREALGGRPIGRNFDGSWIYRTELTGVTIPDTVFRIQSGAFIRNSIAAVTIPDSVISIGRGAFAHNLLSTIAIPRNVFRVDAYAFYNNRITDITIPRNVTEIGDYAFGRNPLTSITFEHDTGTIHQDVFRGSMGRVTRISIGENFSLIYDGERPDVIWNSFREAYAENNHRAGIYTRNAEGGWDWQPR